MKLLSLFSGIGAFESALKRLNIPFELVNFCEIDKYAAKSYSLIHGEDLSKNLGDITKIVPENLPDFDLLTYGFPCQDISKAGKMQGFEKDGVKTRSGLVYDVLKIIEEKKPKVCIAENVKNILSKNFKDGFQDILNKLNQIGYNNYFEVLNSCDFGVPQKRERVFIISIRKDVDDGSFTFPKPQSLTVKFKDLLETDVDERYYLKGRRLDWLMENLEFQLKKKYVEISPEVAITLTARQNASWNGNHVQVLHRETNSQGFIRDGYSIYGTEGICPTLKSSASQRHEKFRLADGRYRFLTPKECFRFMGFSDDDFEKVNGKVSDSQLYKQTGNSIVVNVLVELFKNLKGYL